MHTGVWLPLKFQTRWLALGGLKLNVKNAKPQLNLLVEHVNRAVETACHLASVQANRHHEISCSWRRF